MYCQCPEILFTIYYFFGKIIYVLFLLFFKEENGRGQGRGGEKESFFL